MNGTYGIIRPSLLNIDNDVDIFYNYRPSRSSLDTSFVDFRKIDNPSMILKHSELEENNEVERRLPGMFNLNLPMSIFGKRGIYTLYIMPREIRCRIKAVGVLTAYQNIEGIIIDKSEISSNEELFQKDNLVGYRVEYLHYNNKVFNREDTYRLITSSNLCEPVTQNLSTSYTNSNGYRYTENGSLCFLTLTPSTAPKYRANSKPYIGVPNQMISIYNTKFDPICIELNMVEHDAETISVMLEGEQVRNLENGRVSFYNFDGEIYKQMEYSTVKDNYTTKEIAEIKLDKTKAIDTSLDLNDLKKV